jgi:hypothetical protein
MASNLAVILPPVAVSEETAEALADIARVEDRTKSWLIRRAVEAYVAARHPASEQPRDLRQHGGY